MKTEITTKPTVENEYDELFKEAVEVIETSRLQIAKQVNNVVMSSYWKIGKLLADRKIESKHGDGIVKRLSVDLESKYPDMTSNSSFMKLDIFASYSKLNSYLL